MAPCPSIEEWYTLDTAARNFWTVSNCTVSLHRPLVRECCTITIAAAILSASWTGKGPLGPKSFPAKPSGVVMANPVLTPCKTWPRVSQIGSHHTGMGR